ncbi:MAG TPA: hypothetical protein VEN78_37200, partial [Bradyrhizobium sp.]|nr:hypothetical protein [Bradyrhizobium sp.]
MTIDKRLCRIDRLGIIGAGQRLDCYKMTVAPYGVRPVLCHPRALPPSVFCKHQAPVVESASHS